MTPEQAFERLEWAASIGLDLSPGDPVAAWAVGEIKQLRARIAACAQDSVACWQERA